ncbi:unnamed protein product [marine sediment metagenome]|uniref:Uncharacterized protein n=1 Tax=marine sediment metagenome TaxID=412755 RepID=X1R1M6_9ZZZZ
MPEISNVKILAGREAVEAYRTAHTALHREPWRKTIPEEHTPLLNIMLKAFKGLGFNTIQEFFAASELFNIQEIELDAVFQAKLAEANKDARKYVDEEGNGVVEDTPEAQLLRREALERMWH